MDKQLFDLFGKCVIHLKLRKARMEMEMREVDNILNDLKAMEKKDRPVMDDGQIFESLDQHMEALKNNFGVL